MKLYYWPPIGQHMGLEAHRKHSVVQTRNLSLRSHTELMQGSWVSETTRRPKRSQQSLCHCEPPVQGFVIIDCWTKCRTHSMQLTYSKKSSANRHIHAHQDHGLSVAHPLTQRLVGRLVHGCLPCKSSINSLKSNRLVLLPIPGGIPRWLSCRVFKHTG